MTIVGNVVDEPQLRRTRSGHAVANFRVASTPRRYDREKNMWVDCDTLFVTVTAWRAMGENIAASLHKGQPVVVTGRYYQREYESNEQLRTAYELEAQAVGHDLSRGVSSFEKISRPGPAAVVDLDPDGVPRDVTAEYHDLVADELDAQHGAGAGGAREFVTAG
jgi:single-strand DNA-binding protein